MGHLHAMSMSMSKLIYIAQFHTKHLNCAWCTSIFWTRSSPFCAERHRCLQPVHAVPHAVNFHTFGRPVVSPYRVSTLCFGLALVNHHDSW